MTRQANERAAARKRLSRRPSLASLARKVGEKREGTITRVEEYGAVVNVGARRPGLIHISQLGGDTDGPKGNDFVSDPNDIVQVGDRVVKVNGKDVSSPKEMVAALDALGSDAEVSLTVKRRVEGASDEDLAYALQQERVDKFEDKMVMLYALLFGTMVKVASQLTLLGAAALALGLSLFSLQAYYTFYLWRNAISLRFADLPEGESPWYVRCVRSSLPKARQELRLRYVVSKYAPHGAYWQFVIWLRQCVLLLVELYVGEAKNPLLQAGLVGGVLAIWGVWQRKVRPFAEQVTLPRLSMSQNTLEEGLLLFNIVAISLGMVYHAARDTVGQYVVDAFMSLGIILELLLMGTILVHGSLQFMRGLSKPTVTQPTLVKQTEMYEQTEMSTDRL